MPGCQRVSTQFPSSGQPGRPVAGRRILIVHGTAEQCREQINRYVDNGLDTPIIATLPTGTDLLETARALSPG